MKTEAELIATKKWRQKNKDSDTYKEKNRARAKAHYHANKDKKKAYSKAYYKANKEEICAKQKIYNEANKEGIAATGKKWRLANKESVNARAKAHRESKKLPHTIVYCIPNYNGKGDNYAGVTDNPYMRMCKHKSVGRVNTDKWYVLEEIKCRKEALIIEARYHSEGYHGAKGNSN